MSTNFGLNDCQSLAKVLSMELGANMCEFCLNSSKTMKRIRNIDLLEESPPRCDRKSMKIYDDRGKSNCTPEKYAEMWWRRKTKDHWKSDVILQEKKWLTTGNTWNVRSILNSASLMKSEKETKKENIENEGEPTETSSSKNELNPCRLTREIHESRK